MESKRQLQVAELIKRNFGIVLQQEGSGVYGEAFVTVTNTKVTPDLSLAKVYVSVFNVEDKQSVVDKIQKNMFQLKKALVPRIRRHIRRIPDLAVYIDDTLDEMYKLNDIFDDLD